MLLPRETVKFPSTASNYLATNFDGISFVNVVSNTSCSFRSRYTSVSNSLYSDSYVRVTLFVYFPDTGKRTGVTTVCMVLESGTNKWFVFHTKMINFGSQSREEVTFIRKFIFVHVEYLFYGFFCKIGVPLSFLRCNDAIVRTFFLFYLLYCNLITFVVKEINTCQIRCITLKHIA